MGRIKEGLTMHTEAIDQSQATLLSFNARNKQDQPMARLRRSKTLLRPFLITASLVGKNMTSDHRVAGSSLAGCKANNQNNLSASKKPDRKETKPIVIQ
jgi:hypothetical protein